MAPERRSGPIPGHPGGAFAGIAIGPVDPQHADRFGKLLWYVVVASTAGIVGMLAGAGL